MLIPVLNKLSIDKKGLGITLRDVTGSYDSSTNPGGYGSPNMVFPPAKIGLTCTLWGATSPSVNFVSASSLITNGIVSANGYHWLASDFGLDRFEDGIWNVKYYPFLAFSGAYTVTADSATITVSGYDPTTLDTAYKAALVLNGAGDMITTVLLLTDRPNWTSTTFTVDKKWTGSTTSGCTILFATEADLKVLVTESFMECWTSKVVALSKKQCCNNKLMDKLLQWYAWYLAAVNKAESDCNDYDGAHTLITEAYEECAWCKDLKPCSTCS